jgi:hypothetical protein
MADAIPEKLKGLQLTAFAKRAAQLERFKPIVTYWCEYRIRPLYPRCMLTMSSAIPHVSEDYKKWITFGGPFMHRLYHRSHGEA